MRFEGQIFVKPLIVLLPGSILVSFLCAQTAAPGSTTAPVSATAGTPGLYLTSAQIPPTLLRQFQALGSRVQTPGNERLSLAGTLTTSSGPSNVQIVVQLGGELNITWIAQPSQKIVFNGTAASVTGSIPSSNDLLEALVDDLPETLMLATGTGVRPRLLGQRFTNPAGGLCDYYDVATYGVAVRQAAPQVKRYCFDSSTSLLQTVRYINNASQSTITQFGGWSAVSSQAAPGTITRMVGGAQIFQFQAQSATVSASVADSTFAE
jgi:hypothetical protein